MTKKDYQLFAEAVAKIDDKDERIKMISFLTDIFLRDNSRFNMDRFMEFINRRINSESLKDLRVNPKYLYN